MSLAGLTAFAGPGEPPGRSARSRWPGPFQAGPPAWSVRFAWSGPSGPGSRTRATMRAKGSGPCMPSDAGPAPCPGTATGPASRTRGAAGCRLVRLRYALVRFRCVVRSACCCGPDHPGEQLVRSHEGDCGPRRDDRADQPVGPALGHVNGERGGDAEREHPAGQARYRQAVPCGVQDDHAGRVHQAVDRGGLQKGSDPSLPVLADHGVGVPVRDIRRDARHGEHDRRRGYANRAVRAAANGRQVPVPGGRGGDRGHCPAPGS